MHLSIRKHFWVVHLIVIVICSYFAASALGQFVVSFFPPPKQKELRLGTTASTTVAGSVPREVSQILARNIFCSTCEPEGKVAENVGGEETPEEPLNNEPVKTSLNLKLLATLISEEDKAWSFAVIQGEGKTGLFGIGSKMFGDATVVDVLERKVFLLNEGRNEYLEISEEKNERMPDSPTVSSRLRDVGGSTPDWLAQGVQKTGEGKFEIQRNALNKVLADTTLLARSARIVPSTVNGTPNGFKLFAIRPGSIYSLIGMRNGDTVHAVNDRPITTPDKALEIYTKVRNASHLSINFTRSGKQMTHDYVIR
ncbi:MAG: type II secretion system protein GspC [Pseudomonadota bacterium]